MSALVPDASARGEHYQCLEKKWTCAAVICPFLKISMDIGHFARCLIVRECEVSTFDRLAHRRRMEEFGISLEALSTSIEHDKTHPPLYRDARGHEWNGLGDMPDWLIAAKNAGVNPDFFRIEAAPNAEAPFVKPPVATQVADPRQLDLFDLA